MTIRLKRTGDGEYLYTRGQYAWLINRATTAKFTAKVYKRLTPKDKGTLIKIYSRATLQEIRVAIARDIKLKGIKHRRNYPQYEYLDR
jgi:hypothetical protein